MADVRGFIKPTNKTAYYGLMSDNTGMTDLLLTEVNGDKGSRPSLSAYWEQHLPGQQMLVVDFKTQ